ncbi:MAG: hypothetical protein PHD03_02995 [Bacilli bacterium]|nr:hypothetical protein [Bacilli bacterium]MDD4407162.1 hypothetical protein [Bacilli bacterium]
MKVNIKVKKILLLLAILIISLIYGLSAIKKDSQALIIYNANVTVIERRSGKEVITNIDENSKDKLTEHLSIYSNIFNIGDKLKIEYYQDGNNFYISNINPLITTYNEKKELVNKISGDPTVLRYQEQIFREEKIENNNLSLILANPDIIKGQTYVTMNPNEFYKLKYENYNNNDYIIPKNKTTKIIGNISFKVISFKNYFEEEVIDINYKYEDNYDKDTIIFKGIGKGIYNLKIEFKNKDVINYIFI